MEAMFRETNSCPQDSSRWEIRERQFNCSNSNPEEVYHCLQDDNGRLGEICIAGLPLRVQPNYCPEYNQYNGNLNTFSCNISAGCPDAAFDSNEVYKYPVCLQGRYTSTAEIPRSTSTSVYDGGSSTLPWNIIGVLVGVIVLLVALGVVVFLCYMKRRKKQTTNKKDEHIPLLSKEIPFHKTSTFHKANKFLKDGGKVLCLIGQWGSGKSTTCKQVYMSLTGKTPIIIEDILKFDVSSCQESVIVEEPLLREDLSETEKSNIVEKVTSLCKQIQKTDNTFLIITSTEESWTTIAEKMKGSLSQNNELHYIDINLNNLKDVDRIQILHTIFEYYNPETPFSTVEKAFLRTESNSVGFPELCTLLSRCRKFQKSPVLFINRPLRNLSLYLKEMCQSPEGKEKFALLMFMSVNDMKIDMKKSNEKLRDIFRSCDLNSKDVDLKSIIPDEFVVEEESSIYVLQHEIIKRITLITFGQFYFSELLRFSSKKDLVGWIKHKRKTFLTPFIERTKETSDIEPFLEINDEQWAEYQGKMELIAQTI